MSSAQSIPCPANVKNLTGQRFGRLTVISYDRRRNRRTYWIAKCDCGVIKSYIGSQLRRGHTQSCGCLQRERTGNANRRHGCSRQTASESGYRAWLSMVQRCTAGNAHEQKYYRSRGVTVCDRWRYSFEAFIQDMGPKPGPKLTLERIDNNGNYEPGNCRWATMAEQCRNRRSNIMITYEGETLCRLDWAKRIGISAGVLGRRIQRFGAEKAIAMLIGSVPLAPRVGGDGQTSSVSTDDAAH